MADELAPIACTLTTKAAARQRLEWVDLRERATGVQVLDDGVRLNVPSDLEHGVRDLAAREAECCAFLDLVVEPVGGGEIAVTITSEQSDALPVIHWMVGLREDV